MGVKFRAASVEMKRSGPQDWVAVSGRGMVLTAGLIWTRNPLVGPTWWAGEIENDRWAWFLSPAQHLVGPRSGYMLGLCFSWSNTGLYTSLLPFLLTKKKKWLWSEVTFFGLLDVIYLSKLLTIINFLTWILNFTALFLFFKLFSIYRN